LNSTQPVPPNVVALARKLVGSMVDIGDIQQRTQRLADGTTIHAQLVDGLPRVTITAPGEQTSQPAVGSSLWVPRGFVVYPAWSDAPFGVGIPIIPDASAGPYDALNTAPGLDRTRWTAGGVWGEVLLSADPDAGYGPRETVAVPFLYYSLRGPQYQGGSPQEGTVPTGTWSSFRLELAPFVPLFQADNIAVQQGLFEGLNAVRVAAGQQPATLRLRGYGRLAETTARLMAVNGTDVASSAVYPPTYQNAYDRLTKEGYSADWIVGPFTGFTRKDVFSTYEFRAVTGSAAAAIAEWNIPDSPLVANFGRSALADAGCCNGYCALTLADNDRWIHAGNMAWKSSDEALPPLSWHGFASVNLAWETYPATYGTADAPLSPLYEFTNAVGDCWLTYPRATSPTSSDVEPGMGRHIFSRGRAIALAPNGGLVWGACVMPNGNSDRLIALIHHPADQPSDFTHNGWTRYLRVWWADVPVRALRIDPEQVICGTDTTDPWGWRGGTLVDMGAMPPPSTGGTLPPDTCSSLKYASQWRFSSDGTRAVCLRDYGTYADYSALDTRGQSQPNGMEGRAVELVFAINGADVGTSVVWHDYTGNPTQPATNVGAITKFRAIAQAVDYGPNNELVFAFVANTNETEGIANSPDTHYLGIGDASAQWFTDLTHCVQYAVEFKTKAQNFTPSDVLVADVRQAAFVVAGMRPEFIAGESGGIIGVNPDWQQCWPFTPANAHGVRMFKGGALIDEHWYPIPDGVVVCPVFTCTIPVEGSSDFLTWLSPANSATVQAYWVERFGEWIFSYQVSPVPQCCRVLSGDPPVAPPPYTNCGCWVSTYDVINNAAWMTAAQLNPRGGRALASVPLPDHDWLIFSKVV
jgi:hypothetical protein